MNLLISLITCLILISGTGTISEIDVTNAEIKNTKTGEIHSLAAFLNGIDRSFLLEIRGREFTTIFLYEGEPITGTINQKGPGEILLREYSVTDGQLDGIGSEYFPNAKPATRVNYQNGFKHGLWEEYYPNGQLAVLGYYIENKRSGTWLNYYENGNIEWRGDFKTGKRDGVWKSFYQNGTIQWTGNYLEGNRNGKWETFYATGIPEWTGDYSKNQRTGTWASYQPDGEVKWFRYY
jgi:antitoxin component YwqK of YwqJK toxin-antitoxin module